MLGIYFIYYENFYFSSAFTGPTVSGRCNIILLYNQSSGRLLFINSTWDTVPVNHITIINKCVHLQPHFLPECTIPKLRMWCLLHGILVCYTHWCHYKPYFWSPLYIASPLSPGVVLTLNKDWIKPCSQAFREIRPGLHDAYMCKAYVDVHGQV